jgi:hypothetical protein
MHAPPKKKYLRLKCLFIRLNDQPTATWVKAMKGRNICAKR